MTVLLFFFTPYGARNLRIYFTSIRFNSGKDFTFLQLASLAVLE
jgi:hypothetical protein